MDMRPILFFDSGVGGLSVVAPTQGLLPFAPIVYAADSAGFPYGTKSEAEIAARVPALLGRLVERYRPRLVVIACNTASTIALPVVRAALDVLPPAATVVVAELVPAGASKGSAIAWLMATPTYAGRQPVFIGDDITDEDGFEAVNAMGGVSVRIGADRESHATCRLASPTALRHILLEAAEGGRLTASSFKQD